MSTTDIQVKYQSIGQSDIFTCGCCSIKVVKSMKSTLSWMRHLILSVRTTQCSRHRGRTGSHPLRVIWVILKTGTNQAGLSRLWPHYSFSTFPFLLFSASPFYFILYFLPVCCQHWFRTQWIAISRLWIWTQLSVCSLEAYSTFYTEWSLDEALIAFSPSHRCPKSKEDDWSRTVDGG